MPSPIEPGDKVGISVPVTGPAGAEIQYEWTAPVGKILEGQDTSGITYEAPSEPGTYKIGLKITSAGVTLERSVFLTVEKKPVSPVPLTPTPTTEPAAAPTQTPPTPSLPSPSPTTEPGIVLTSAPSLAASTPACATYRPPLQDTAGFSGTAKIETPANGATGVLVETPVRVAGTFAEKPQDATLWLMVFAPNNLYYPQSSDPKSGDPMPQAGGRWLVNAWMGGRGGPPECFDLVLVYADAKLNTYIGDWLRHGSATGDYPGMSAAVLQGYGITEKASITVQTAE